MPHSAPRRANARHVRWALFVSAAAAFFTLPLIGGNGETQAQGAGRQPPPPAVQVETVTRRDIPVHFEYAGRTAGSREVEVRARVNGILLERTYREGAVVEQGDVLFRIDPAPYEAKLALAKAHLQEAKARLAKAERDWQRTQKLFKRGTASEAARDEALSALELARANVAASEADLRSARINLDYTTVDAPISGVTSLEARSEGSLVGTGQDNGLLTRITQLDPIHVSFAIPEAEMIAQRRLREAGKLEIPADGRLTVRVLSGDRAESQDGVVDFTDSTVDRETGTIRARAVVPNPGRTLLPGQFVRVVLTGITRADTIVIPEEAVMQGPQGAFVYVLDDTDTATIRPVTAGRTIPQGWIIEDGLEEGDRVVVSGVIKVRPGAPVRPVPAPEGETAAKPAGGDQ